MSYRFKIVSRTVIRTLCCFSCLFFISFIPILVSAQINESYFSLSPAKAEIVIEPGETLYLPFTLSNFLGRPATFNVLFEDIIAPNDPTLAFEIKKTTPNPYSLNADITINESQFSLLPGEEKRFSLTLSMPNDSLPGSRHGILLVTTESLEARTETKTVSRLGGVILVKVAGDKKEIGQLADFKIIGGRLITKSPIRFQVVFNNSGNVYLNPYGLIEIKNLITRSRRMIEVDPWFVLPAADRWREVIVSNNGWGGFYQATLMLNRGYDDIIDNQS